MFAFAKQIQIAADAAKNGAAYLAGVESPKFDNTRADVCRVDPAGEEDHRVRERLRAAEIDGTEEKEINIPRGDTMLTYSGQDYLLNRVLPNFFFHITTAYDILRHNGVELGKRDYLGRT